MAAGPVEHVRQRRADRVDRAEHVDPDHLLGSLDLGVGERAVVGDAGVGHHQVEPLGALREPVDGPLHLAALGDVGDQRQMRAGRALGEPLDAASSRRSRSRATSPSRAPRDASARHSGAADAARGAGDDRPRAGLDPHRRILSRRRPAAR